MDAEYIGSLEVVALSRLLRRREEVKRHADGTPGSGWNGR
jgi:hypothetical protein